MDIIKQIEDVLKKHPGIPYQIENNTISVDPKSADGFCVWLTCNEAEYIIGYEGWHQHFTDIQDALEWFWNGLTNKYRLKVKSASGKPYSWTTEILEDGKWLSCGLTSLIMLAFWKKKTVSYLQNSWIDSDTTPFPFMEI
jgi:hypothetical protein